MPILGEYFKRTDVDHRRTNLLVFITPKIIRDQHDAREQTIDRRDVLEDAIFQQDSGPDRSDVLHHRNIDRVFNENQLPEQALLPSTIRPLPSSSSTQEAENTPVTKEQSALNRTQSRLNALIEERPQPRSSETKEEVLDISVTPKLPGAASKKSVRNTPRPKLSRQAAVAKPSDRKKVHVVLRPAEKDFSALGPFPYADTYGTIGLAVDGDLTLPSAQFFEAGKRYEFTDGETTQEFICLGKYGSHKEARALHSALHPKENWYHLSPQETLTLGNGPWKRK